MSKLIAHVQTYISRYALLAAAVLGPVGVLLGALAADAGGANTSIGRAIGGIAGAVPLALGVAKFMEGAKDWQLAKLLGPMLGVVFPGKAGVPAAGTTVQVHAAGAPASKPATVTLSRGTDEGGLDDEFAAELLSGITPADPSVIPPDRGDQAAMDRDGIKRPDGWTIEGSSHLVSEESLLARGPGVVLSSAHDRLTARRLAVAAAQLGLRHAAELHYTEGTERWQGIARGLRAIHGQFPTEADCSSFVSWCLWTASRAWHLGDFANGEGWLDGYTGTLVRHGVPVTDGHYLLADVALYGDPFGPTGHTALLAGAVHGVPYVISNGSEAGPFFLPLHYRTDLLVVRRMIR